MDRATLLGVMLAVPFLSAPAAADVIHVPAEKASVGAAVASAVDGDLILVAAGNYPEVVVLDGLGVSVVGHGGVVRVRSVTVRNIPAGEAVLLQNLEAGPLGAVGNDDDDGITCLDSQGAIRIESCTAFGDGGSAGSVIPFSSPVDGGSGLRIVACQDVVVTHGSFFGGGGGTVFDEDFQISSSDGGPGVNLRTSRVALFGVVADGGNGGSIEDTLSHSGGDGGAGLLNVSAVAHVSGCTLVGGTGGNADCDHFAGFCGAGGLGGDAIRQTTAAASLSVRDNTSQPGAGGVGGDGTPSPAGEALDLDGGSAQTYAPSYRDLALTSSVAEGEHALVTITGEPGDLLVALVALAPGWLEKPALHGLYQVSGPMSVQVIGVLVAPELVLDTVVPELGPGLLHLVGRVQLVVGDSAGVHLGPSASLVLRDAAE